LPVLNKPTILFGKTLSELLFKFSKEVNTSTQSDARNSRKVT